jgi:hypothetical protein
MEDGGNTKKSGRGAYGHMLADRVANDSSGTPAPQQPQRASEQSSKTAPAPAEHVHRIGRSAKLFDQISGLRHKERDRASSTELRLLLV